MNISDTQRFKNYRFDLMVICTNGRTYLQLYQKMFTVFAESKLLFQLSPTFFAYSRDGLLECSVSNLCKLYDIHKDSLSVRKYLNYVDQNKTKLFKEENQKAVTELIKMDNASLSNESKTLEILGTWRDKRLFHLDKKYAGDLYYVFRNYSLSLDQFNSLFTLAKDIINHYSQYYDGETYLMEYPIIDTEFENLVQQLSAGKLDMVIERLRGLSKLM